MRELTSECGGQDCGCMIVEYLWYQSRGIQKALVLFGARRGRYL